MKRNSQVCEINPAICELEEPTPPYLSNPLHYAIPLEELFPEVNFILGGNPSLGDDTN